MSEIKINLGCGNDRKENYINIDHDPKYSKADRIEDIRCMNFEPNSVDEILAEGCLEHITYREVLPTLIHWFTILKPNGMLIIETPNLMEVIEDYKKNPGVFGCHPYETLFGGQRNPAEFHLGLYTADMLEMMLIIVGFKDIARLMPTKNLDKSNQWNLRFSGKKLFEWSFPFCFKCKVNGGKHVHDESCPPNDSHYEIGAFSKVK